MGHYDSCYESDYEESRKRRVKRLARQRRKFNAALKELMYMIPDSNEDQVKVKLEEAKMWANK